MPKTILITGAAGSVGRKLTAHFRSKRHTLLLVDVAAPPQDDLIEQVDLAEWGAWADRFRGVDCIIHLAAHADIDADWRSLARNNIDATLNVFEAAARGGAKRVIYASSGFVVEGHRDSDLPIDEDVAPAPINPYGASKLAGEWIARSFSASRDLSVICFRIGACGGDGENRSCLQLGDTLWQQRKWLSDRDLRDAFDRGVHAPDSIRFEIFNLVSSNRGMRWDMSKAERLLGFRAADGGVPRVPSPRERMKRRLKAWLASVLSRFSPRPPKAGAMVDAPRKG
ncbi:NAD(P)-dependent oxidoreductase [Mesorhizobium sp. KR9-304]|uniref:NAD-dependent epimerase/dehydratase family protein n=1 Tax=Mesorhizobium sp. KR9-304 TaxID=3156614 RepID=UPI0032B3C789